jgi:hypothetical protein
MEMYKKPVMDIIDLERIDVLTCSKDESLNGSHYENDGCASDCETHSNALSNQSE